MSLIKRNAHREGGFTLIETLVAMTIFAVAVLGLGAGTISVVRNNNHSYLNTSAVNLAQTKVEELRAMNATAFATLSCTSYSTPGCSDNPVASGKTFDRRWQITADSPVTGVDKIDVQISWTDYTSHSLVVSGSSSR
jgi:prepilin-type N-terminal cleavage/methylation domain-containing protein